MLCHLPGKFGNFRNAQGACRPGRLVTEAHHSRQHGGSSNAGMEVRKEAGGGEAFPRRHRQILMSHLSSPGSAFDESTLPSCGADRLLVEHLSGFVAMAWGKFYFSQTLAG